MLEREGTDYYERDDRSTRAWVEHRVTDLSDASEYEQVVGFAPEAR